MDRENVIKGLECCTQPSCECAADCPYSNARHVRMSCCDVLMADALALLKAQEPRVISYQDAESMRLCWIETRFPHTISPADIMHYFAESPNITVFKIHQTTMDWPIKEYGIKWRCWNNEPTDEQMEAEKWE